MKKTTLFLSLFFVFPQLLLAQSSLVERWQAWPESAQVVAFFFVLLTLATILNRLFEFLVELSKWIYLQSPLLRDMWNEIWQALQEKLAALDPHFQDPNLSDKLRGKLRILLIQLSVFLVGSVLGVWLCSVLNLGMLRTLGFIPEKSFWDYVLTGVLVASGTEPVHAIFRIIEAKKDKKKLQSLASASWKANAAQTGGNSKETAGVTNR